MSKGVLLLDFGVFIQPGVLRDFLLWFFFHGFHLGLISLPQENRLATVDETLSLEDLSTICVEILWSMCIVILIECE